MARGSPTSEDVRREVWRLYLDTEARSPRKIAEALEQDPRFDGRVPSERTISNITKAIAGRYDDEQRHLDQPWQLRPANPDGTLPDGISVDAVPTLLSMLPGVAMNYGFKYLTIRIARWVSILGLWVDDLDAMKLYFRAGIYAARERWAAIENRPFNTTDLDTELAFARWRSKDRNTAYEMLVDKDLIPAPADLETQTRMEFVGQPVDELARIYKLLENVEREWRETRARTHQETE